MNLSNYKVTHRMVEGELEKVDEELMEKVRKAALSTREGGGGDGGSVDGGTQSIPDGNGAEGPEAKNFGKGLPEVVDVRVDADAGTTGTELGEHDAIGTTGSNGGTVSVDQHELLDSKKKAPIATEFKQQTQVQQRLIDQLNAVFPGLTGPLEKELLSKFSDLGELTENVFLRNSSLILQPGSDGVFEIAPDAVGDALQQLKLSEWKRDNLGPVLEKHTAEVIDSTVDAIGNVVNIAINVPDYVARELIRDGGKRVGLIDVIGDTKKAMFRALEEGRELGEGADAVARRIRRYVPEGRFRNAGKNYRAKMIARTETKWSQNESSLRAYEQSSDITHVVAFDAQLGADRSDPDCIARNGREFNIAGARAEMGKEHPNGTLSFAPVVKPGAARTRPSGEGGFDGQLGPVADNQPTFDRATPRTNW